MRIACLGWGSLVWRPDSLPIVASKWYPDGPELPIEFARRSSNDRVTLVLVPDRPTVTTLWGELACESSHEAIRRLAIREGVSPHRLALDIGFWTATADSGGQWRELIRKWAVPKAIECVVWTALPYKWERNGDRVASAEEVVGHLRQLQDKHNHQLAEEYVRKAPKQIRTPYREKIEHALGWYSVGERG